MNFIEALKAVEKGEIVVSCQGFIYTEEILKPQKLSDTAYVSRSITTDKENRGKWRLLSAL